jgi:transcriptional regulator with XRE-family HTH domain
MARTAGHGILYAEVPWATDPVVMSARSQAFDEERVVTGTSPTVRQRELGKRLRDLRNQHDLTVEDVARRLLCSATKISRLETGARRPSLRDVRDLCALYELDEVTSAELMTLARGAREQGWWTQYEDIQLDPYIGLEAVATAITSYSMYYVPALLQTEEYARALIKAIAPKIDPAVHEQRVEVRLRRQQLLEADRRPRYRVLLDEAVLHRRVGGPKIMAAQLGKILEAERRAKVTVQVVPFELGAHAAQDSNFVFLEFEDQKLSPVIFVEGLTGNQYIERSADIARYREAVEYLRDSALSPRDSLQRVDQVRKMHTGA